VGSGSLGSGKLIGGGARGVVDRSLPLFELLGALDGLREIEGLWDEELEVDGESRGLIVDVGMVVVVVVGVGVGVSGFLVGKGRFKSKTAGSMASSE
jgi:hypothetical protein